MTNALATSDTDALHTHVAAVLRAAKQAIEQDGWIQGAMFSGPNPMHITPAPEPDAPNEIATLTRRARDLARRRYPGLTFAPLANGNYPPENILPAFAAQALSQAIIRRWPDRVFSIHSDPLTIAQQFNNHKNTNEADVIEALGLAAQLAEGTA